jgi:drug/metabolite transporter (DMT)-like permease
MFVLSGAMAAGFAYTVIRAASSAVSSETIIFYFSWVTVVLAGIWMMMSQSYTLSSEQMCQVVEMGVFASIGQISMTRAYLYAPASYVSQMSLLNPVLGAGLGVLYLNEMLSIQQWLGVMGLFVSLSGISYLQMKGIEKEI